MPYEYKRKQDCRQKNGDKGTYVTKKQGASSQKCWKSETAFDNSKQAQHASMSELDEGPKGDPGPNPGTEKAKGTPKTGNKPRSLQSLGCP